MMIRYRAALNPSLIITPSSPNRTPFFLFFSKSLSLFFERERLVSGVPATKTCCGALIALPFLFRSL